MNWLVDLDGVVWLAERPIPGVAEAVARLRASGARVSFVTNNSSVLLGDQEAKLASIGIPARDDVLTSAGAAALMLEPGSTALVCGGPGVVEALGRRGVSAVADGDADAVVVGFDRGFDYTRLRAAAGAVRRGARLIGTNDDPTYPTAEGLIPGGGALLAAVAYAAEVEPEVAGKPYPPMAALARSLLGDGPTTVVGDRPSTDGRFARMLGARFVLVLTGVTAPSDLPVDPAPDVVAPDFPTLVREELGRGVQPSS